KAVSSDEAIDFAVDAAVQGGRFVGLNVPPDAAHLLKELVKCGVDGGTVPDCAKQSVIKVALRSLPDEAEKIAGCMLGKANPAGSGRAALVRGGRVQARRVVECRRGGGTVAACAGKGALGEALARVPAEVRPVLECLGNGGNAASCGAQAAANALPPG